MTTPVQDPGYARGPTPVHTTAIQPYTQPAPVAGAPLSFVDLDVDEAMIQQRVILDSGAYTRPPLLHPLGNGRALLITEVVPPTRPRNLPLSPTGDRDGSHSGGPTCSPVVRSWGSPPASLFSWSGLSVWSPW